MKLNTLLRLVWDHVRVAAGRERRYFLGHDAGTGYDALVVMRRLRDGTIDVVDVVVRASADQTGDDRERTSPAQGADG